MTGQVLVESFRKLGNNLIDAYGLYAIPSGTTELLIGALGTDWYRESWSNNYATEVVVNLAYFDEALHGYDKTGWIILIDPNMKAGRSEKTWTEIKRTPQDRNMCSLMRESIQNESMMEWWLATSN